MVYLNVTSNPIGVLTALDLSGFDWEGQFELQIYDTDVKCDCGIDFIKALGSLNNTMAQKLSVITCEHADGTQMTVMDVEDQNCNGKFSI